MKKKLSSILLQEKMLPNVNIQNFDIFILVYTSIQSYIAQDYFDSKKHKNWFNQSDLLQQECGRVWNPQAGERLELTCRNSNTIKNFCYVFLCCISASLFLNSSLSSCCSDCLSVHLSVFVCFFETYCKNNALCSSPVFNLQAKFPRKSYPLFINFSLKIGK